MLASHDQVHLWHLALDPDADRLARLAATLDAEETARAKRFHFEIHQRRFTAGRGWLRTVLAAYLDCQPTDIRFKYGPFGKPALATEFGDPPLRFNLSHTADVGLLAVTAGRELGADVEEFRPLEDGDRLAERCFSERERADYYALAHELRVAAFMHGWTRKEAYLKACGSGISRPLEDFDVTLIPGQPPRLVEVRHQPAEAARWQLHSWAATPQVMAAIVVEGTGWQPRFCTLDELDGCARQTEE